VKKKAKLKIHQISKIGKAIKMGHRLVVIKSGGGERE
jgi:hypothetical protein